MLLHDDTLCIRVPEEKTRQSQTSVKHLVKGIYHVKTISPRITTQKFSRF